MPIAMVACGGTMKLHVKQLLIDILLQLLLTHHHIFQSFYTLIDFFISFENDLLSSLSVQSTVTLMLIWPPDRANWYMDKVFFQSGSRENAITDNVCT